MQYTIHISGKSIFRAAAASISAVAATIWATFFYSGEVRGDEPMTSVTEQSQLAIDEGLFVDINGMPQWITIRGHDLNNPVLLFLHGGPGIGLSGMAPIFANWEKQYTVVQWDQPSSGATYIKNMATGHGAMTVDRYVRDGLTVVEYVRQRLGKEKVIVMGSSWGTILGLEMIKRQPKFFSAYVGTAQVVSGKEGGKLGYELALQAARQRHDTVAIQALERVGSPPYKSLEDFLVRQQYSNPPGLPASAAEQAANLAVAKLFSAPPPADARYNAYKTLPPGFNPNKMFMDTLRSLYPVTWTWEARDLGLEFKVPVFVFQGADDINTPATLARKYMDEVKAPAKAFIAIPGASHNTIVFHEELLHLLNKYVLPIVTTG